MTNPSPPALHRIATAELVAEARAIAGLKLVKPEFASAGNVSGIRTRSVTFSRRHDSLTMFVSRVDYGYGRPAGAWTGPDKVLVTACRRILRNAKVAAGEIAAIEIQREMGQTAERVAGNEFRIGEPTLLRKIAVARRAIRGLPVWSSHTTVGLTAKGQLGHLVFHWPQVPDVIMREATLLHQLVKKGFKPPALPGATPESVEAGVIHSPAIGFSMDIVAVIRVIYAADAPGIGRKPVLHLDRHGEPVEPPRSIRVEAPKVVKREPGSAPRVPLETRQT